MKTNSFFSNANVSLSESIQMYQKGLMDDINLTLRLFYNEAYDLTKPAEWVDTQITFEAPMRGLDYMIYAKDTLLESVFVSKNALFTCLIRIVKNYRQDHTLYYVGEIVSPLEKKQQREAFRLDVVLPLNYQVLPQEMTDVVLKDLPTYTGTCLNLSTGGMCLNTDLKLEGGSQVVLTFSFLDTPFTFYGQVLMSGERTEIGNYTHRLRFLEGDKNALNHLNRLIFKKQQMQLKHL